MIAVTIVLLMTPAAYHRIGERGEETEHFHRFASTVLLAAMFTLAPGICGDLFVVARIVTQSTSLALAVSLAVLVVFYGLWFVLPIFLRKDPPELRHETDHRQQ